VPKRYPPVNLLHFSVAPQEVVSSRTDHVARTDQRKKTRSAQPGEQTYAVAPASTVSTVPEILRPPSPSKNATVLGDILNVCDPSERTAMDDALLLFADGRFP
jgi:hypothetical protein